LHIFNSSSSKVWQVKSGKSSLAKNCFYHELNSGFIFSKSHRVEDKLKESFDEEDMWFIYRNQDNEIVKTDNDVNGENTI
jgi:hypothetical protein